MATYVRAETNGTRFALSAEMDDLLPMLVARLDSAEEIADAVRTFLAGQVTILPLDALPADDGPHVLELHAADLAEPLVTTATPAGEPVAKLVPLRLAGLDDEARIRLEAFVTEHGWPERPSADALLDLTIGGRYRIEARLGGGAMGTVYRARHLALDRLVALKVLNTHHRGDPSFSVRFAREARAASRLDHPGILRVLDFGEDRGLLFMAMDLLEGRTLEEVARSESMSPERIVRIGVKICDALAAAHDRGVVHRDVKPENVMLLDDGTRGDSVIVCDFGIATLEGDSGVTGAGHVCGTPDYLSPEQARGEPVDARSDVYSCGILLYRLLTGILPFHRRTPLATVLAHLTDEAPSPVTLAPSLDPFLSSVVERAIAREPHARFPSAHALRDALEQAAPCAGDRAPASRELWLENLARAAVGDRANERDSARAVLVGLGDEGARTLLSVRVGRDLDRVARGRFVEAMRELARSSSAALASALVDAVSSRPSDAALLEDLLRALVPPVADPRAVATVVALGHHRELAVRRAALSALASFATPAGRASLVSAVMDEDEDEAVRIQALGGLRRLGAIDGEVVRRLAAILDPRACASGELRAFAAAVLADVQFGARDAAIEALRGALAPRSRGVMGLLRGDASDEPAVLETVARVLVQLAPEEGARIVEARARRASGDLRARLLAAARVS